VGKGIKESLLAAKGTREESREAFLSRRHG
jgi:hypothetical protein